MYRGTSMIIMINGAFGVGKTTVSKLLDEQLENSMIFDPEEVGLMLRNTLPDYIKQNEKENGDFQNLHLWKKLTVQMARILIEKYNMTLIVPMTLWKKENFTYIKEGFKEIEQATYHFCLTASEEVIHERLRNRGEGEGNWCFQQTSKCLQAFETYNFEMYIDTENKSPEKIVETMLDVMKVKK